MIHADVLGERARLSPESEALSVFDRSGKLVRYTYRQLDLAAEQVARVLQRAGLRRGDRVGLLAENRVEYVEAFCAAIKAGLVLVKLGTRLTSSELGHLIADSGLKVLLYGAQFRDRVVALQSKHVLDRWISLDPSGSDPYLSDLIAQLPPAPTTRAVVRSAPEDVCALIYTSGTTGKPKGVMLTQKMVAWNALNTVVSWQLQPTDVTSVFTPLYHAAGFGCFMLPLFAVGGRVVLQRQFDAGAVLEVIARERCSVVLGVPTIFKLLVEHEAFATTDLSSLRWLISGGAPLPRELIDVYRNRGIPLRQGFGMTEAGVNCFAMSNEDAFDKAGSIGRPMFYHEARIVDADGNRLGPDQVGQLELRGPHLFKGYWNNEPASRAAFDGEGWFDTGDLARYDKDGFFYIAGRKKEMFISGGVNVYPAEIEAVLLAHPAVLDAAVVGVLDEKWGEAGVAFLITRPGASLDKIRAHLEQHLARYKLPRELRLVDELPRTPYGKVKKHELLAQLQDAD